MSNILSEVHPELVAEVAVTEQQPRFNSIEFEKLIPHHMRFKETDLVNGNEMYWVTQEIFTAGDLRKFQQAVQSYDGDIKKFYVTPRDLSPSGYQGGGTAEEGSKRVCPFRRKKDD